MRTMLWNDAQGFATGEMGLGVSLHGSNSEPPMSALGQKQTLGKVRLMSALSPKADIGTGPYHPRRSLAIFAASRCASSLVSSLAR
jgi:hypothetical protein